MLFLVSFGSEYSLKLANTEPFIFSTIAFNSCIHTTMYASYSCRYAKKHPYSSAYRTRELRTTKQIEIFEIRLLTGEVASNSASRRYDVNTMLLKSLTPWQVRQVF